LKFYSSKIDCQEGNKLYFVYFMDECLTKSTDYQLRCIVAEVLKGNNVILHGPGGTGKSYSIMSIVDALLAYKKRVMCTATTGIAALNISGKVAASTLHSWAGVGLATGDVNILVRYATKNKKAVERWKNTEILVLDEVSMLGADFLDKLDGVGQAIRKNKAPFGGLQLILSGDFLQLPPVKDGWSFESKVWPLLHLVAFSFKEPKRYDDVGYFNLLLRIREGTHTFGDINILKTRANVYKQLQEKLKKSDSVNVIKPTILYSLKADVDTYNKAELDKLEGPEFTYTATDSFTGAAKGGMNSKAEDYKKLLNDAMPEKVVLKVGAQVMLKTNLDVNMGLVNGSRGVILEIAPNHVYVRFVNGQKMVVAPYSWKIEDKDGSATRTQMPFILAYSLTIHKTQGCTLDYVVCDLGSSVFAAGQAYVALSRVKNLKSLFISSFHERCITTDKKALGFVGLLEKSVKDCTPIPQEEWDDMIGRFKKAYMEESSESLEDVVVGMLGKLGISTKKEWFEWALHNHPDKGGNEDVFKEVLNEVKTKGW